MGRPVRRAMYDFPDPDGPAMRITFAFCSVTCGGSGWA